MFVNLKYRGKKDPNGTSLENVKQIPKQTTGGSSFQMLQTVSLDLLMMMILKCPPSVPVASVISDYTSSMPPVLDSGPASVLTSQSILLHNADLSVYEGVMTCLAREGFSISLDVQLDNNNAVYFFVKDRPAHSVKRLKSVKLKHRTRVLSLRRKVVTRQISGKIKENNKEI